MTFEEINAQLDAEFTCDCAEAAVCYLVCSNGTKQWKRQCQRCGHASNPIARLSLSLEQRLAAKPLDPEIGEAWRAARQSGRQELVEATQPDRSADYEEYLRSEWWRSRSRKRLEVDGYRCQALFPGCEGRATQVHHRTYASQEAPRYGEPLFALVSVCRNCHEWIHGLRGGKP
jgi:hypothetical protein